MEREVKKVLIGFGGAFLVFLVATFWSLTRQAKEAPKMNNSGTITLSDDLRGDIQRLKVEEMTNSFRIGKAFEMVKENIAKRYQLKFHLLQPPDPHAGLIDFDDYTINAETYELKPKPKPEPAKPAEAKKP